MIFQLCESLSNVILGFCKRIRRFPQDLLVFFWKIRVKNQGNFFHQIFGQATFVDKMKTLLTDTYGFGPSNLIMSRNCEAFFIPPLYHLYKPYDLKNLYFFSVFWNLPTQVNICWPKHVLLKSRHLLKNTNSDDTAVSSLTSKENDLKLLILVKNSDTFTVY